MADTAEEKLEEAKEAARQMAMWRRRRDERIREARAAGASLREAANAAGVHHSTIRVIEEKP